MKTTKLSEMVTVNGYINIRLALMDGEDRQWHRAAFVPREDVDAYIAAYIAAINTNITAMGYPPLPQADVDTILIEARNKWTPDLINQHKPSPPKPQPPSKAELKTLVAGKPRTVSGAFQALDELVEALY